MTFYLAQIMGTNTSVGCQGHGIEPELALSIRVSHMDVRWLKAFIRVKMKSECANAENGGHRLSVPRWGLRSESFVARVRSGHAFGQRSAPTLPSCPASANISGP